MKHYQRERAVAIEAVKKACGLCRDVRAGDLFGETMEKSDKSPVTVADFGAQAVISREIAKAFPDDFIMAEESLKGVGEELKEKILRYARGTLPGLTDGEILAAIDRCTFQGGPEGRFWTVDPIDGTKGFLRNDQYAIALALIEDGEVVLGTLGCPNLPMVLDRPDEQKGCIFVALKGQGSYARLIDNPREQGIVAAGIVDPEEASFCESVESSHTSHSRSARIADLLGVKNPPIRIDSQCKYGIVARGDASIYLRIPTRPGYEEKVWDHAAGWLIMKEAGGEVTDVQGNPLDFTTGCTLTKNAGIVATNGPFHDRVVAAVQEVVSSEECAS
jgi:3'(2'), 5'-bisphosphate nucleotidase